MQIIYARQPLTKSIFLAGPTPRSADVQSWRPAAINILHDICRFDGVVLVPEDAAGSRAFEYDDQVTWEWEAINQSTIVAFWVPRELKTMPAMVTNVEFGMLAATGKVVLGAPPDAQKMGYLKTLAQRFNVPVYDSLTGTLIEAVRRTKQQYGLFNQQL